MATTAQSIADAAWSTLGDTVGTPGSRWTSAEVLRHINDGQREAVVQLPSAYTKATIATLAAGTRQTFAGLSITDAVRFLRMTRNFESNGTTPGRSVTTRPIGWIDAERPDWHLDTAGATVHCFYDPLDPKAFYVWPKAGGTLKAEIIYSAVPPAVAAIGDNISLDDIYSNALRYYVLFCAMSKQANFARNELASTFYQLFLQSLGVKGQQDKANDANRLMASDGAGVATQGA